MGNCHLLKMDVLQMMAGQTTLCLSYIIQGYYMNQKRDIITLYLDALEKNMGDSYHHKQTDMRIVCRFLFYQKIALLLFIRLFFHI